MRKFASLLFFAAFSAINVYAQKEDEIAWPNLPIDKETGKITYTEVVKVDGVSANDLYDRAMKWFTDYFKNPAEKLRKEDKDNGEIEAFIRYKIYNKDKKGEQASDAGLVQYSLILQFKDGRYKYTFTDFNHKEVSYFAIEQWMDKTDEMAAKHADYLTQVDDQIKEVIKAMVAGIADDGKKPVDDW